jgi:hypothetical protein
MKINIIIILITVIFGNSFQNKYDLITAEVIPKDDYRREDNLESYKHDINEQGISNPPMWTAWGVPFEKSFASSSLKSSKNSNYNINNISDQDISTAWVEGKEGYGIGEKFWFELGNYGIHFGNAFDFKGEFILFNGYCKSEGHWKNNSRVKKLLMYFNDEPFCEVFLQDTWHLQHFDVGQYFTGLKSDKPNNEAKFVIKNKTDKITFEILEVYEGEKYDDVCISEFLFYGAHEHKSFNAPTKNNSPR